MMNKIPHFKYRNKSQTSRYFGCIEMGNEIIHSIIDLDAFYQQFGYSVEYAKQGILPDEFIWDTYFKNSCGNCFNRYQLKMLEYLLKHSAKFVNAYGDECKNWIAAYSDTKIDCNFSACANRLQLADA